ncbi:MAG: hypothetical protein EOP84_07930 [Verrucomicrobiaceae bacterium]|nr:MAG: hypothetical protein EOP84_07930 [Verrucomicrobiaceae bacterium]
MDHFDADIVRAEMLRISQVLVPLLLHGDDPELEILRNQWRTANLSISFPSASGFYADISVQRDTPTAAAANQGGGNAEIPVKDETHPAGCVLYVVDGRLKFLEVYTVVDWGAPPIFGLPSHVEPLQLAPIASGA